MNEQKQAGIATVVLIIIWIAILASVGWGAEPNVPFEYDPNLCTAIMDWAYAEPNIPIIYTVSLYFPVADPNVMDVNDMTMDVNAPSDVNMVTQYWGVRPVIPVGYIHVWTMSFMPKEETVYYINIATDYSYKLASYSNAWSERQVTGHDECTILLNSTKHRPALQPGPSPESVAAALRHIQYANKHGQNIGYAQVLNNDSGKTDYR